jgi:SMODS and SLOG-associating 2TM effector domain 2
MMAPFRAPTFAVAARNNLASASRIDYPSSMADAKSSAQKEIGVPRDLRPAEAAEFSWADSQRSGSLKKLRDVVADKIDMTAGWYMRGKKGRRIFGRSARVGAMVLATLAAAQPTIAEMYQSQNHFWSRPGIATICALVAAALLLLDRFFGASTGWVRYMTAGLALNDLRDEFENAWRLETAAWGEQEPNVDQTKHAVTLLYGFIVRVNEIVRTETEAWKAEFQSALQQVEEYAKAAPRKIEQSGLKVVITNIDKLDGAWRISVNGGEAESVTSPEKTFSLTPGQTQLVVEAMLRESKKTVRREEIVMLKAGEISTVSLSLS